MKIEAGKFYRTRDGRKAWIIGPVGSGWFSGHIGATDHQRDWQESGAYLYDRDSPKDLVAEWQDELETTSETPTPSEPDWIPWSGGECPVHRDAVVLINWHDGERPATGAEVNWNNTYFTAYRVLWTPPAEKPKRSGEVWVNILMPIGHPPAEMIPFGVPNNSRADADEQVAHSSYSRLACIRVQWTEGEGL